MASNFEVTLYLEAFLTGAAGLLQDFPVVGAVCKAFLTFTQAVETATSNKDDLTELKELCNLVIKGVLQQRWEQKTGDDLDDGFEKLKMCIERANEIANKCHGNAVKQFIFSRRTSRDVAAIRKSVMGLCTANTLLLSASMHVSELQSSVRCIFRAQERSTPARFRSFLKGFFMTSMVRAGGGGGVVYETAIDHAQQCCVFGHPDDKQSNNSETDAYVRPACGKPVAELCDQQQNELQNG